MRLTLTKLTGTFFDDEVISLNIKTASGEITVLDHHRPLVTMLEPGEAHIRGRDGKETSVYVNGGFLEVNHRNEISVLAD